MADVDRASRWWPSWVTGRRIGFLLLGVGAVVLLFGAGRWLSSFLPVVTERIDRLGALAPLVFILMYAAAEIVMVPGSLLTLTAGALFGVVGGTTVAFVGATLGASFAFLIARYVVRRRVEQWVRASPKLASLDDAVAAEGRKIVFLVRLTPLIPFNALNYTLGVTQVRFVDYLVGSIGMVPGTLLYAYYGHVAGDVARLAAGTAPPRDPAYYALLAAGLVATLGLSLVLARIARRAITIPTLAGTE
jgi:uncharacterized membrane protein YdjX (TVP38/TMEM64 family)